MPDTAFRSDGPIASALDIVGDRWTLLIRRDMVFGAGRFSDFAAKPEGIKRNILTDRLRRMEETGLIAREAYNAHRPRFRYRPTPRGAALLPVTQALARWGADHITHSYDPLDALMGMLAAEGL
jgi:DNA-binding HxlR family transcriptional regulator